MWTKATVLGGVAAVALVAGGAGMAIASAQGTAGPDVATVSPTGDPSPTVAPSTSRRSSPFFEKTRRRRLATRGGWRRKSRSSPRSRRNGVPTARPRPPIIAAAGLAMAQRLAAQGGQAG